MLKLETPWPGLALVASRVDLRPVLHTLGLARAGGAERPPQPAERAAAVASNGSVGAPVEPLGASAEPLVDPVEPLVGPVEPLVDPVEPLVGSRAGADPTSVRHTKGTRADPRRPSPWPDRTGWPGRTGAWPSLPGGLRIEQLREAGLSPADAMTVLCAPAWVSRPGVRFIHAGAPGWPVLLEGLEHGPVAFAAEGNLALLSRPCMAIVGARACTAYGREWAARIAAAVAGAGGVVVSGLAAGIDATAHGAAGGSTIAVLGQGIDAPMPAWQQRVRDTLLDKGGLVLSELPPTARATPFTFPTRNRIIAGLARSVAVIEAGKRSGARNTAAHATRYRRRVLALPGPLGALASEGCLDLIEGGATVIRGAWTVLEAAGLGSPPPQHSGPAGEAGAVERVWSHLGAARTHEEVATLAGLSYREVREALGILELTGRATRLSGGRYQARPP